MVSFWRLAISTKKRTVGWVCVKLCGKIIRKQYDRLKWSIRGEDIDVTKYNTTLDKIGCFAKAIASLSWNTLVPLASSIQGIVEMLSKSDKSKPIVRIESYKKLLKKVLHMLDKEVAEKLSEWRSVSRNVYVILEDVDRSWQEWRFFLETVKWFLNDLDRSDFNVITNIILICPISDFEDHFEHYLKVLDYYDFWECERHMSQFVREAFPGISESWWKLIDDLIKYFLRYWSYRELKFVLRKISHEYSISSYQEKSIDEFLFYVLNFWSFRNDQRSSGKRFEFYQAPAAVETNAHKTHVKQFLSMLVEMKVLEYDGNINALNGISLNVQDVDNFNLGVPNQFGNVVLKIPSKYMIKLRKRSSI